MRSIVSAVLSLALALTPVVVRADSATVLEQKRLQSCESRAFDTVSKDGAKTYTHKAFKIAAPARVAGAELEWCLSATNAVIFFYVDDPTGSQHSRCPQTMSLAVFPGRGGDVRDIIDGNVELYGGPDVKVIKPVKTGPTLIDVNGRKIDAYQLEAVIDQNGAPTRKRMIGYAKGADFVRVMTGYVDDGVCGAKPVDAFLAQLTWP